MLQDPNLLELYYAFTVENYVEEEIRFYKDAREEHSVSVCVCVCVGVGGGGGGGPAPRRC